MHPIQHLAWLSLKMRVASHFMLRYYMRMDSRLSNPSRRTPMQDRSSQRVKSMLQAAAGLIAQVGYEKMTMTGIARRAATSVGSLYQYFPDKQTIAQALFEELGQEMEERW